MKQNIEQEKSIINETLLNSIPGGIIIVKVVENNIECLYFNEAFAKLSGRTHDELQRYLDGGVNVIDIIYEADRKKFLTSILCKIQSDNEVDERYRYYTATGKRMNSTKAVEFRAYQNARKVVAKNTRKSMSKSQKLETCFRWVMKRYYRTWRRFSQGGKAWYAVNANDHFERGCGDCIADASAFAYLAKALGYKNVYVCTDGYRNDENSHGWAEINGRVYDPLFAEAKSYSRNYGVRYGVYPLSPVMRVKIA